MAADTRTFTTTPPKLQALALMLAGHGITLDPTQATGDAVQGGWDIYWKVTSADAPNVSIAITVNKHPFAEEGALWSKLGAILD